MGCIGCQSCMAQAYNAIFHAAVKLRCSCELCVSLKSLLGSEALAELCRWCAGSPSAAMASLRARSSATTATLIDWGKADGECGVRRVYAQADRVPQRSPCICRSRFWRSDVAWYGANGAPDLSPDSHSIAYVVHGASVGDKDVLVMVNMYWQDVSFVLQEPGPWRRVVDTSLDDIAGPIPFAGPSVLVGARSVIVAVSN